jgi:hypothetical protein
MLHYLLPTALSTNVSRGRFNTTPLAEQILGKNINCFKHRILLIESCAFPIAQKKNAVIIHTACKQTSAATAAG